MEPCGKWEMIGENSVLAEEKYHLHSEMAENRPHQLFSSENVSEAGMCVVFWGREPLKNNKRTTAQHCASQSCQLAHQKTKNAPELFQKKSRFTVFVLT